MLWDPVREIFVAEAVSGYDAELMGQMNLGAGESITGKVYHQMEAVLLETQVEVERAMRDMHPANREIMRRSLGIDTLPRSAVATPIRVGERKFGVLVLESLRGPVDFTREDLPFVQTVADLIALAIDRDQMDQEAHALREAKQADRVRSEVMASLSHELRTPLAAIKGYTTALMMDEIEWADEKEQEFLRLIDEECDNLQTMISDLLDSSLIEVGQMGIEVQPVRMPKLAEEVAGEIQLRTSTHQLVVEFLPEFPIVDADPGRIRQVLRNILDNAVKYSPNGGLIVIRGEVRPTQVVISVSDQGVGISPEDLIPLFEKYFRVKDSTGYHVAGTGLGLPVAREIVEAHGGRIWAESKIGEGTTLSFSLPTHGLSSGLGS
jgi:K+-sensing histidine kinase KdpD